MQKQSNKFMGLFIDPKATVVDIFREKAIFVNKIPQSQKLSG